MDGLFMTIFHGERRELGKKYGLGSSRNRVGRIGVSGCEHARARKRGRSRGNT